MTRLLQKAKSSVTGARLRFGGFLRHEGSCKRDKELLSHYDREFDLIHVLVQSWMPFPIQICINGHSWLDRTLDRYGIGCLASGDTRYERRETNSTTEDAGEDGGDFGLIVAA